MSGALARPIDFRQLSGNLFSGIVLKDVVIYSQAPVKNQTYFIKADLVTIYPSLRFITNGLSDIIGKVNVNGVLLNVNRLESKKVNIIEFVKALSSKSGESGASPSRLTIQFNDISGTYTDVRGWEKSPRSFRLPFQVGKGQLHLIHQER